MTSLISTASLIKENFWPLIKSRQTFLLTFTGMAGYLYHQSHPTDWVRLVGLLGSLFLSISGCSVINMLFDRDIDRLMRRTRERPLANGQVQPTSAAYVGIILISTGLVWALILSGLFFIVVSAGVVFNILVYTLWLKRRTAWSILWGGIAGSMPIVAGRVLQVGHLDSTSLVLGLVIMCWIPSHNLTLTSLYSAEYQAAGVPTFTSTYGPAITRALVVLSGFFTALLSILAFSWLHPASYLLWLFVVISIGLVGLSIMAWVNQAQNLTKRLYKYSSFYMLFVMLLLALGSMI